MSHYLNARLFVETYFIMGGHLADVNKKFKIYSYSLKDNKISNILKGFGYKNTHEKHSANRV
jgi:hypothetical protein